MESSRFSFRLHQILTIGCSALILIWTVWWVFSMHQDHLLYVEHFWFGKFPAFGADFLQTVDQPARTWVQGNDPYAREHLFVYPPLVPRLFAWTTLVSPDTALNISIWILAFSAILGAWCSWKTRIDLCIDAIPLAVSTSAILFSFPVIFGMERANFDLLILPFLVISVFLLKKGSPSSEIIAGVVLSLTPWLKIYPGLLAVGLFALKKWKAMIAFITSGLLIGLVNIHETFRFIRNTRIHINEAKGILAMSVDKKILPWHHSLTECWGWLWMNTPLESISGYLGTAVMLGILLIWVGIYIYRCPGRQVLTYPYLTWILSLATFVPAVSNDYNLFFIPLTALAIWDHRDPIIVHIGMLPVLLWWQPLYLPIDGRALLFIKLFALIVLSISLIKRSRELSALH